MGINMDQLATYNFLLVFHSMYDPILYHFQIADNIWKKISHLLVFNFSTEGIL